MIVGVCGYGATGSSAVTDLLKEFEELQVFNSAEFKYAYQVDGLQDLEYHLIKRSARHMSGDMAIKRFIEMSKYINTPIVKKPVPKKEYIKSTKDYVDSLIQAKWIGIESADYEVGFLPKSVCNLGFKKFVFPFFEKTFKKSYNIWPSRYIYLSIKPDDFYEKSRVYIKNLLKDMGADLERKIVLDQPFEANSPENSFCFFENPKAIVVDRDPRDLFLLARCIGLGESRFMPRTDVKAFVEYYKKLRIYQKREDSENIIFIRFEDLIYNYEITVKKISDFLDLGEHSYPKKYLKPEVSIYNTQLYNKYKNFKEEIKYIENELSEYLFPFDKYEKIEKFGKTF